MQSLRRIAPVIALAISTGCVSYTARPLEGRQEASSIVEQKEAEGLFVAVKDLTSTRQSIKYFDRDLKDHGYAPVLVLLESDQGSPHAFDVRREDLLLCLRDGQKLPTADPADVAANVSFSHVRSFFGFLLIVPGFFVASSVNSANDELESDYQAKAIQSVRVNPNMRSFRAVVFFEIPPEGIDSFTMEDAFVEFKIYIQGRGEAMGKTVEFPVHFAK